MFIFGSRNDFIIRSGGGPLKATRCSHLHQVWFRFTAGFSFHSGTDQTLGGDAVEPSADAEDHLNVCTDSLSRLRSPSVMEVKEKGYEKLKEELAKAQRVRYQSLSQTRPPLMC